MALTWADKVAFVMEYRSKRYNDLNTVQEFDLGKQKTTKTRVPKEPKEKSIRKVKQKDLINLSSEQLDLLKQLGVC